MEVLEVRELTKSYGQIRALKGISFSVGRGEIFGLLGPNGAGKTTAVSVISTLLKPDSGSVLYQGKDIFSNPRWWRKRIGFVPQEMAFYEELTAEENLLLWASLYGMPAREAKKRAWQLLEELNLASRGKDKVSTFSGGMKRRLNLALGLVHNPEFLILDEPTVGIDVHAKVYIREFLRNLAEQGVSMIYTTHQLEEAEQLCHRIAIMDEGRILVQGPLEDLLASLKESRTIILRGEFEREQLAEALSAFEGAELINFSENKAIVELKEEEDIPELMGELLKRGLKISTVDIRKPNLETLFLKLTGKELRD